MGCIPSGFVMAQLSFACNLFLIRCCSCINFHALHSENIYWKIQILQCFPHFISSIMKRTEMQKFSAQILVFAAVGSNIYD